MDGQSRLESVAAGWTALHRSVDSRYRDATGKRKPWAGCINLVLSTEYMVEPARRSYWRRGGNEVEMPGSVGDEKGKETWAKRSVSQVRPYSRSRSFANKIRWWEEGVMRPGWKRMAIPVLSAYPPHERARRCRNAYASACSSLTALERGGESVTMTVVGGGRWEGRREEGKGRECRSGPAPACGGRASLSQHDWTLRRRAEWLRCP